MFRLILIDTQAVLRTRNLDDIGCETYDAAIDYLKRQRQAWYASEQFVGRRMAVQAWNGKRGRHGAWEVVA